MRGRARGASPNPVAKSAMRQTNAQPRKTATISDPPRRGSDASSAIYSSEGTPSMEGESNHNAHGETGSATGSKASDSNHFGVKGEAGDTAPIDDVLTKVEVPEWLDMILAATSISYLMFRIDQERAKRSEDFFMNPYPTTYGIVTSMKFEIGIGFMIILNSFVIGWEASTDGDDLKDFFNVCEHFFVMLFFLEWCLRMLAFGWVWVFEFANFCDTVLVFVTGVLIKWILEPSGVDVGFLRIFTVMRTLRLARLAKSVRLNPFFKELWILIQGLITSVRPLFWTLVMALVILYVFAVAATELIGRRDVFQDDDHIQERFGNLMRSLFTMFQLMTLDSWCGDIVRPVMQRDYGLCIFFVFFIGIAVFVFWNLITAIIVENAFSIAKRDSAHQAKEAELQKKRELQGLVALFLQIDQDGSGELSKDEFLKAMNNKKVKQTIDILELKMSELNAVWDTLDDGNGGGLTVKEFANGIRRMKGEAKSKDIIDTVKRLRHTSLGCSELKAQVDQFGTTVSGLETDIRKISTDTGEIVGLFQEMHHRLQVHIEQNQRADRLKREQDERAAEAERRAAFLDTQGGLVAQPDATAGSPEVAPGS